MSIKRHEGHEREIPHAHIYHASMPVAFFIIWFLDSNIFRISIILNYFVPFLIRLILFILVFICAIVFIMLSHRILFKSHEAPNSLITNGILGYVRNPMYLGILLIYVAFILLSISLISIGIFVIVFLVYNRMVNFEEQILEDMFGKQYLEYRNKVPKFIPNPFRKYKE
ncbi:MAG: isoprenylcysteine carboxylmethyltransferase family protein [Promethearchaeota archaeon]|nr:MAG: isoprenylcysteine carboxylmethyltransferase family protein [Candidatus Lokiarchaeota archaeon]